MDDSGFGAAGSCERRCRRKRPGRATSTRRSVSPSWRRARSRPRRHFRGELAGPRQTIVYSSTEDNIEYRVTVMSFIQAQAEGATILGEREYMFQDHKKVLIGHLRAASSPARNSVYGRKIVVELPDNKGRATGAFYFNKGKLIALEATVPAHGDIGSPDPAGSSIRSPSRPPWRSRVPSSWRRPGWNDRGGPVEAQNPTGSFRGRRSRNPKSITTKRAGYGFRVRR